MPCKTESEAEDFTRRIADYEIISGVLWLFIGIVQIITCWLAIAGVWNIFAAISRFMMSTKIKERRPEVPDSFESITQLVLIAGVNLLLGGILGIFIALLDFYIRDQVLMNRHVFNGQGKIPEASQSVDILESLERIGKLYGEGILSEDEFKKEKQIILNQLSEQNKPQEKHK